MLIAFSCIQVGRLDWMLAQLVPPRPITSPLDREVERLPGGVAVDDAESGAEQAVDHGRVDV
jgi:hypothetical protein